jgi:hypothetical protein
MITFVLDAIFMRRLFFTACEIVILLLTYGRQLAFRVKLFSTKTIVMIGYGMAFTAPPCSCSWQLSGGSGGRGMLCAWIVS